MTFQVWLPYPDVTNSVQCLSQVHLSLQRYYILEMMEVFHAIPEDSTALPDDYDPHHLAGSDHPILDQWIGYELTLCEIGLTACEEWQMRRGHQDPMYDKIRFHLECATTEDADFGKPNWWGDVEFHLSHQAALLREDKSHYKGYFLCDGDKGLVYPTSRYATQT